MKVDRNNVLSAWKRNEIECPSCRRDRIAWNKRIRIEWQASEFRARGYRMVLYR